MTGTPCAQPPASETGRTGSLKDAVACSSQCQHHGTGPSCPHAGMRTRPLAPCGSRCRGNPTCLPQRITAKTRGQQATKGLHCPHGPHWAPHGAWLSAPRPERHPPGWAGGQSTWRAPTAELWEYRPGAAQSPGRGSLAQGKFRNQRRCLFAVSKDWEGGWLELPGQGQQRGSAEADL